MVTKKTLLINVRRGSGESEGLRKYQESEWESKLGEWVAVLKLSDHPLQSSGLRWERGLLSPLQVGLGQRDISVH